MKNFIYIALALHMLLTSCTPKRCDLAEEEARSSSLDCVTAFLTKRYALKCLSTHLGTLVDDKEAAWGISLMSQSSYTLTQVRPLALAVISAYVQRILTDPLFEKEWSKKTYRKNPCISKSAIAIKLAFWDVNFERPQYPYIAEVRYTYGTINYYYADPITQKLEKPIQEAFTELNTEECLPCSFL